VEGQALELASEDVVVHIAPREGYVFQSIRDLFVALDVTLTPELLLEGYARELINKIQFTRKEQGFEIMDRVLVSYDGDEDIRKAVEAYGDRICSETLCDRLSRIEDMTDGQEIDINGKPVRLLVSRVQS